MPFTFPFTMLAIDLETTDSDPEIGSIIQIGAEVINERLDILGRFSVLIKPLDNQWSSQAQKIHKLTPEYLEEHGAKPLTAIEAFEEFTRQFGTKLILASWGNYFDVTFLQEYYKRINRIWNFSYRSVDLKSIALWEMAERGIPMNAAKGHGVETFLETLGMDFEGTPHNALNDISNTVRILQFLRNNSPFVSQEGNLPDLQRAPRRGNRSMSPREFGRSIRMPSEMSAERLIESVMNDINSPSSHNMDGVDTPPVSFLPRMIIPSDLINPPDRLENPTNIPDPF